MALIDKFFKEVHIGTAVSVVYAGIREVGIIVSLDTETVDIQRHGKGRVSIELSSIQSFEVMDSVSTQAETATLSNVAENNISAESDFHNEAKQTVSSVLDDRCSVSYISICRDAEPLPDDKISDWDNTVERVFRYSDPSVQNKLSGEIIPFFRKLMDMRKQPNKSIKFSTDLQYFQTMIQSMKVNHPEIGDCLECLLASAAFQLREYRSAVTHYRKGNDYEGAYYAAYKLNDQEAMESCLERYVQSQEYVTLDKFLYANYAKMAARRHDVFSLYRQMVYRMNAFPKDSGAEQEENNLNILLSCAELISYFANIPCGWLKGKITALERLKAFFANLPITWSKESALPRTKVFPSISASSLKVPPQPIKPAPAPLVHPQPNVSSGRLEILPPLESFPPHEDIFVNLEPMPSSLPAGKLFETGRAYELKGDLSRAESYFIRSIQADERVSTTIASLVNVYLRSDENKLVNAIDLMNAYGNKLALDTRRNLEISIYKKGKTRPYKIKLCHVCEQYLDQAPRMNTKLDYLATEGNALRQLGEYRAALSCYQRWRHLYVNEAQSQSKRQFASQLYAIKRCEAICYYFLNEKSRATELAQEVLRYISTDDTSIRIVNGTLQEPSKLQEVEATMDNEVLYGDYDEYQLNSVELSPFVQDRLKDLDITLYVKNRHVQNGRYTGSPDEAENDISFYRSRPGHKGELRSTDMLCSAWIVLEMLDRIQKQPNLEAVLDKYSITETKAKIYIGESMTSYGDFMLSKAMGQMDTTRFCYLQALSLMTQNRIDWRHSLNRFIKSYFNGQKEMREKVDQENNVSASKDKALIRQNLFSSNPTTLQVGEFVVGMLQLIRILSLNNVEYVGRLTYQLYSSNLRRSVMEWLESQSIEGGDSYEDFNHALKNGQTRLDEVEQRLKRNLESIPQQALSMEACRQLLMDMDHPDYKSWLNYTDALRLKLVRKLLSGLRDYWMTSEFTRKMEILSDASEKIKRLNSEIRDLPTQLSYDCYAPALESLLNTLNKEANWLYEQLPPEIEVTQPVPAHQDQDGNVLVHLLIRNGNEKNRGNERQRADNIRLEIIDSEDGVTPRGEFPVLLDALYGGRSSEKILTFRLSDHMNTLGTFPLVVRYTYSYDISPSESKENSAIFRDMIVIRRDNNAKINNPFRDYVGNPMHEPSMFYGRQKIIDDLLAMIRTESGRLNYGHGALLYGQTRAGKSSIAYHFVEKLKEREGDNIILVDMGNLETIVSTGNDQNESFFYSDFLTRLSADIEKRHPDLNVFLQAKNITPPIDKVIAEPKLAQFLFTGYLRRICEIIQNHEAGPEKMVVVVLDEFSCIHSAMENKSLPSSFMRTWKAMLQNYGLFAVCFGQDDTPQFVREHENAFMSMELIKVSYLDEFPAKELIWRPIAIKEGENKEALENRFDEQSLNILYHLTYGSAFLIVKLCSSLVDYLNKMGVNALGVGSVTSALIQSFLDKEVLTPKGCFEERDFEPQINDRGDPDCRNDNLNLLIAIARESLETGKALISDLQCNISDSRKLQLLYRLEERDVIEITENRDCRIMVELLAEWLRMKYGENAEHREE